MQWLALPLEAAGTRWLPIADHTAVQLAVALAVGEQGRAELARTRRALARDPALALWAACHGFRDQATPSCDALALWLSENALATLAVMPPRPESGGSQAVAGEVEHIADLAASSLLIATLAGRIAGRFQVDYEAAVLLGLLHDVPAWLGLEHGASGDITLAMPRWLVAANDEIAAIGADAGFRPTSPAGCVAAALALVRGQALDCLAGVVDAAGIEQQWAEQRAGWLQPADGSVLWPLISKLARLHALSEHLQQTLEEEKLESLKELAQGAGHEINNPLANISARAQTLLQGERDADRRRMLAAIHSQALRANEMIADMMLFARPPEPKLADVDLAALVGELIDELRPRATQQQTQLALSLPTAQIVLAADATQLQVALRALVANALEALVAGGRIEITLAVDDASRYQATITVADDGPGIPAEIRRHAFDPFFSGREAGRGVGLGLSKCWRIVKLHHGSIEVLDGAPRGAIFRVTLPVRQTRQAASESAG